MTITHETVQLLPRLPFKYYEHDPLTSINVAPHWHEGIELNYLLAGDELHFVTDGQTTLYHPGDLWAVNRRVVHSATGSDTADWQEFGIIIDDDFLQKQLPASSNWQVTLAGEHSAIDAPAAYQEIRQQLLAIRTLIQQGLSDQRRLLIMSHLFRIFVALDESYTVPINTQKINPNANLTDSVMTYINQNFAEELTGRNLARQFHVSLTTLNQQFNKNLQMSISHYIRLVRLMNARRLLLETNQKVTFIASSSGFANDKTLNRNFKVWKGLTPGEYRQAYARYHQK
ncbi:MAG: AraC family transcriptional regulator [Lactobacillaceae bacterium]|jgi:AraC-like DNA-binding protein|nr:AraC family transcriptional regulator [Lactobacillaceae bacterium]